MPRMICTISLLFDKMPLSVTDWTVFAKSRMPSLKCTSAVWCGIDLTAAVNSSTLFAKTVNAVLVDKLLSALRTVLSILASDDLIAAISDCTMCLYDINSKTDVGLTDRMQPSQVNDIVLCSPTNRAVGLVIP